MIMRRSTRLVALVSAAAILLVTGCSSSPKQTAAGTQSPSTATASKDQVLHIGLNADPPNLDPMKSSALVDRQVFQSLYDSLVQLDTSLNIAPDLADKWEVSADGTTYTFHLHPGVKFQDGTDFNADAVKFNFDRMMDPANKSPRLSELGTLQTVTVIDPNTVQMKLQKPFAGFLAALTDRAGMMVSPTAAKKAGADFGSNPVGTGPFKFVSRMKGDSITLTKNDGYWQQGLPKASGVVYKIVTDENVKLVNLQSGQLDVTDTVPPSQVSALASDNRVKVLNYPSMQYQGLWLNAKQAPLDNQQIRQAIDIAIDRASFVNVIFGQSATPVWGPFPAGTPANDGTPVPALDLNKAKQLVAQSGVKNPTFELKVSNSPINQQIGQVLQSMLAQAGITVNLKTEEFGTILNELDSKNFQAAQIGWSGRPDPDGDIYTFFHTGGAQNYASYSSPAVDKLLEDARIPTDMAQRKPLYTQAMAQIHQDTPYIFLYSPKVVIGTGPKVTGFLQIPDGLIRTAALSK
ncbi:MAG: ABC transporter substrate-binding protein [Mycobacterium leprae]